MERGRGEEDLSSKVFKKKIEFDFSGGGAAGNHHAGAIKLAGEDEDLPPSS